MTVSVAEQAEIFLYSILCGILIGIVFDLFRITRRLIHTGNAVTFIEDLIFWLITLITVFCCAVRFNYGVMRWYMFAAIAIGSSIYFLTLSRLIMLISVWVIELLKKTIAIVFKILMLPLHFAAKILRRPLIFVVNIGRSGIKRLLSKININILSFKKYFKQLKKSKNML